MQQDNRKIVNATKCYNGTIKFKSRLEKSTYNTLRQLGFNPLYEPETFTLWEGFTPITPFYDKESVTQKKKRIEGGSPVKDTLLVHKQAKITGIRYTPDFYFKYKDLDVYIETKGFENDVFYIKKKMFRFFLDARFTFTGQHSIFFEIYTKKQLLQAIQIIKEYEKSIRESERVDSNSTKEGYTNSE